jgi:hypothetical protein
MRWLGQSMEVQRGGRRRRRRCGGEGQRKEEDDGEGGGGRARGEGKEEVMGGGGWLVAEREFFTHSITNLYESGKVERVAAQQLVQWWV